MWVFLCVFWLAMDENDDTKRKRKEHMSCIHLICWCCWIRWVILISIHPNENLNTNICNMRLGNSMIRATMVGTPLFLGDNTTGQRRYRPGTAPRGGKWRDHERSWVEISKKFLNISSMSMKVFVNDFLCFLVIFWIFDVFWKSCCSESLIPILLFFVFFFCYQRLLGLEGRRSTIL